MVRGSLALVVLILGLLTLGASAAAGGGCAPADSVHTRGSGTSVEIAKCKFAPVVLFAPVGATVTWKVTESGPPHNIHGLGWGMSGGSLISAGVDTQATFDRAGIYPYQCTLHPGMSGVVIVGDGQLAAAANSTPLVATATQRNALDPLVGAIAGGALALTAAGAYRIGRRRTGSA
jgi:plastocyanin